MADYTDKEQLTTMVNTDEKTLQDEIIPSPKNETDNPKEQTVNKEMETFLEKAVSKASNESNIPKQDIENMEVHHHKHKHHKEERNWKSYFWEFSMLFLAVLCGSFAEYGLDHKIENDREGQFIETMISDLKEDTTLLGESITQFKQKGIEIDSLINLLNATNIKDQGSILYYYGRLASRFNFFTSTDRTIQQMKNSGAFRLVKKNDAATGISKYYSDMNAVYLLQNNTNDLAMEYRSMAYTIFNPVVFETMVNDETKNIIRKPVGNPLLVSYDKSAVERISSTLHYVKGLRLVLYDRYTYLLKNAIELIELLKKEYRLE